MPTVSLEEAKAHLGEIIERLHPGETMTITHDDKAIACLTGAVELKPQRRLGSLKGTVLAIAADFDEPLEEFREYTE
jgi:antitoxin (DNA-binding transcriptional repressor) of toxin-antitoxin stability system